MTHRQFTIEDFGFASASLSAENEGILRQLATMILAGAGAMPAFARVSRVVVTGHAKGTNPKRHALKRGDMAKAALVRYLRVFDATSDTSKVVAGEPVATKVASNSQVTGKDRKVTIRVEWPAQPKEDPATMLARHWAQRYFSRQKLSGWEAIGSHSFLATEHERGGKKKVWVGPERLWKSEFKSAPLVEKYLQNYAALLHFAPIQGVPDMANPKKDRRDFQKKFRGKLDRRIRLFEVEEFLTALYTGSPEFGGGPVLRPLKVALAAVIERYQGAVVLRISKERNRRTRGLLGPKQLQPVAAGGGPLVQRAMIKNAIYGAVATLLTADQGQSRQLAQSIAKNCGTIVGFAVNEHSRLMRQNEKVLRAGLDVVFIALGTVAPPVGMAPALALLKVGAGSLINAGRIGLDEIKTEFERQANVMQDSGANPRLSNRLKVDIVQEFRDGCDTVFQP